VPIDSNFLGSASRLAVFFQIASGARPPRRGRTSSAPSVAEGDVYVLEPAQVVDQMMPGLWLDERSIVTGASASQLAYAIAMEKRKTSTRVPLRRAGHGAPDREVPGEVAAALKSAPLPRDGSGRPASTTGPAPPQPREPACPRLPPGVVPAGPVGPGGARGDRRVRGGGLRRPDNSLFARNELALPTVVPPSAARRWCARATPLQVAVDPGEGARTTRSRTPTCARATRTWSFASRSPGTRRRCISTPRRWTRPSGFKPPGGPALGRAVHQPEEGRPDLAVARTTSSSPTGPTARRWSGSTTAR
jgi:hypothetical protein